MNNRKYRIAVIGSGVYGSYVTDCLLKQSNCDVTLFELGNSSSRKEEECGLGIEVHTGNYSGAKDGRYFGLGGTSTKWGGKVLFFDENSFGIKGKFLKQIVDLNIKYSNTVSNKLKILQEKSLKSKHVRGYRLEQANWMYPFRKNFFKLFRIAKRVEVRQNTRVISIVNEADSKIRLVYLRSDEIVHEEFDFAFLCAGAFESARILVDSGFESSCLPFADHIGRVFCESEGDLRIDEIDFRYKLSGFSLNTLRLASESSGRSFYIHPIYDFNTGIMALVKSIVKKELSSQLCHNMVISLYRDIGWLLRSFKTKGIEPPGGRWRLNITMENIDEYNQIIFEKKSLHEPSKMRIKYRVSDETKHIVDLAAFKAYQELKTEELRWIKCELGNNYEDVYHPFAILKFKDLNDFMTKYGRVICLSTGILPRSGSINPTGAVLPVIEFLANEKPWTK